MNVVWRSFFEHTPTIGSNPPPSRLLGITYDHINRSSCSQTSAPGSELRVGTPAAWHQRLEANAAPASMDGIGEALNFRGNMSKKQIVRKFEREGQQKTERALRKARKAEGTALKDKSKPEAGRQAVETKGRHA